MVILEIINYRFKSCYFQLLNKLIRKDLKNRFKYYINEIEYKTLKSISNNKILPISIRIKAFHNLKNLRSITKIRNICIYTGRPRGVIKKYGLSRFVFRNFADNGYITGLKRAS